MITQVVSRVLRPYLRCVLYVRSRTLDQLRCLSINNSITAWQLSQNNVTSPRSVVSASATIHTSAQLEAKHKKQFSKIPRSMEDLYTGEQKEWLSHNEVVYPPMTDNNLVRPAEVTHLRYGIRYSVKRFWYMSLMIRGMSVDEACKQLSFYNKRGANIIKEIIEEAIEMAVKDHNVEYRSNLWISDAYSTPCRPYGYGFYRRGRGHGIDVIRYSYANYYIRLREGKPPKRMYSDRLDGHEQFEDYIQFKRNQKIYKSGV